MNKAHAHIKRDSQVADGFRQGIVEAKEKKAAAEVSMANQDRALSEAKTKRASRMTREAKTKHSANTAKKPAGEAEALTNGIVEKAEEVKSKARATNEAFKELSGKVAERTSKHERTGKSSHKEKKSRRRRKTRRRTCRRRPSPRRRTLRRRPGGARAGKAIESFQSEKQSLQAEATKAT